jgi:VWFA-related protein
MDRGRIGLLLAVFAFASLRAAAPQTPVQTPVRTPVQAPAQSHVPAPAEAPAAVGPQSPATSPDSAESLPTIHVTTRLVILDVVVSDGHNHPAAGLKPSDFALTEDGVPQTIDSFTEYDVAPPNPSTMQTEALPPDTFAVQPAVTSSGAMTVIVLGGYGPFIRDQLREYFQTAELTAPTAIFRIDWQGMHLVQGFTADRKVLLGAVNSHRIWPPLGFQPASFVQAVGTPTQRLAAYLAGIPGRINLIWIGGRTPTEELAKDFPDESLSFAGVASMVGSLNRTTDVRRLSRVALSSIMLGGCGGPPPAVARIRPFTPASVDGGFTQDEMEPQVNSPKDAAAAFAASDLSDMVTAAGGRSFRCTDPSKAIAQVTATGSHYYTISYRPTNSDWNGAYRRIHLDVAGHAQPPFTLRWVQLITGWADDVEPTLMYRQGYFARSAPERNPNPNFGSAALTSATPNVSTTIGPHAQPVPQRKLISISPKGDFGPHQAQIQAAIAFGSVTPFQVHFTVVVTPAPEKVKTKRDDDLPTGNFLTPPFRDAPYRNFRIHYWIDPQDFHFVRAANGLYHDELRTIAIVYRDDGIAANSYATTTHFDLSAADVEAIQVSGFTLDQTLAIPISAADNFFLRAAVDEEPTGRIGAIEIPAEYIKAPPPNPQLPLQAGP